MTHQPILMRTIASRGIVIEQSGERALVNGRDCTICSAAEIDTNPRHWLTDALAAHRANGSNGTVAAIVQAEINGEWVRIGLNTEQYALGAPERERIATAQREYMARDAARSADESAFDRANNEGGEGYNPHRVGAERTYACGRNVDRRYPDGA